MLLGGLILAVAIAGSLGPEESGSRVTPLTWWQSFNRAGGHAASLATGLLGFAEIIWDANRQALHDRISRTVVVREPRKA